LARMDTPVVCIYGWGKSYGRRSCGCDGSYELCELKKLLLKLNPRTNSRFDEVKKVISIHLKFANST
jgi:hypothetical protein